MTTPKEVRQIHWRIINNEYNEFDFDKAAAFLLEYADLLQKQLDADRRSATMSEEYTRSISKRMGEIRCQ